MGKNKTSIFDLTAYESPFGDWQKSTTLHPTTPNNQPAPYKNTQANQQSTIYDTKPKVVSDSGAYVLKGNYLKHGIIWKGFRHQWILTNHRTNRLGSLIVPETDYEEQGNHQAKANRVQIIHTGASGTASDVLRHVDYFTEVKSEKTVFYSGVVEQKVSGKSGEMTDFIFDVEVPIAPTLNADFDHTAKIFLNGFDIFCNPEGRARKLNYWEIDTSQVTLSRNNAGNKFIFQLSGKIKLECLSGECTNFAGEDDSTLNKFTYTIRLAFLLIGGEEFTATKLADLAETPENYKELIIQKTNTQEEVFSILDKTHPVGTGKVMGASFCKFKFPTTQNSAICTAIHRIKYENHATKHNTFFGVPHGNKHAYAHMLEYDFAIHREELTTGNTLILDRSLFFKNWHAGIKNINFFELIKFENKNKRNNTEWQIKNNNSSSTLSFRTGGDFEMEMGLSLLTFDEQANVSSIKSTDELYNQAEDSNIIRRDYYQDKMKILKPEVALGLIENYYSPADRRPLIVWAALDTPSDGIYMQGACELSTPFNLPPDENKEYEKPITCDISFPLNTLIYSLED
jgi:hypothetical protein